MRKTVPAEKKRSKRVKSGGDCALAAPLGHRSVRWSKRSDVCHGQAPRRGQLSEKRGAHQCFSADADGRLPGDFFLKV